MASEPLQRFVTELKTAEAVAAHQSSYHLAKSEVLMGVAASVRQRFYQLIETKTIPAVIRSAPMVSRTLSFSFNTTAARTVIKITLNPWKGYR